jgi:hypothetical protein
VKRLLFVTAVVLFARNARPADSAPDDDKRTCFRAVDEAQRLHIAHKLVAARDQFLLCARPTCPVLFRNDCVGWLSEVQAALPSVVFGARDSQGQDLMDVHVFVDGKPITSRLEGTSSDVDPGPHTFRFEWAGHGAIEQQAVIREGEKDRLLTVTFTPGHLLPATARPDRPPPATAPIPVGVWIFGGLAVAGVAGYTGLFLSSASDLRHLQSTCAPTCPASDVDSARTKYILSYASLGLGIASAGFASTWFLVSRSRSSHQGETTSLSIEPTPAGARASLRVSF